MRALGINQIKTLVVPRVLTSRPAMAMVRVVADTLGMFGEW